MKKGFLIFLALLLIATTLFAHRLNEYLQAATINLSRTKVFLELRLTPGVAIAPELLKNIDLNNDNQISETEQRAYLEQLAHDISLTIDGHTTLLKAVSFSFPSVETLRKGTGDIIIDYAAGIAQQNSSHRIIVKNNHHSAIAIYLVNCLLPADTGIHVIEQTRNANQSVYQLAFTTGYTKSAATAHQQQALDKANYQAVIKTYFVHGIRHILTGYDHLLFLCALILGVAGFWDLVKIVTAFTIAHSITLTLATFGYAHLPE